MRLGILSCLFLLAIPVDAAARTLYSEINRLRLGDGYCAAARNLPPLQPQSALERVARLSDGELADELRRTLADTRAGASLTMALQALADRTALVPLARFVDGVVVAVERGTPLADVLHAQAQDVREVGQRALMDAAGKKEILMMIPVVFLILPVTVLFAVYPGFAFLRLGL